MPPHVTPKQDFHRDVQFFKSSYQCNPFPEWKERLAFVMELPWN